MSWRALQVPAQVAALHPPGGGHMPQPVPSDSQQQHWSHAEAEAAMHSRTRARTWIATMLPARKGGLWFTVRRM